jgi:hypothetical protein
MASSFGSVSRVGGRDRPWAPVAVAAINGELDGLIGWRRFSPGGSLMINPTTARTLIMGGPEATTWFSFEAGDYGRYDRDWLKPGEVIERLNCSAVDLRYLEVQGHLWSTPKAEKTIDRRKFSRMWMTTREAAARLGWSRAMCGKRWSGITCEILWATAFISVMSWNRSWRWR